MGNFRFQICFNRENYTTLIYVLVQNILSRSFGFLIQIKKAARDITGSFLDIELLIFFELISIS